MPELNLELEILRNGRHEDYLDVQADPENVNLLRGVVINWLQGHKWHEGRWTEFEALVRYAGEGKVRSKVRPK
jgi:hypothetical protein